MDYVVASTNAVGTVVSVVSIGALVAPWIPNPRASPKTISFIITNIGVPAMMFSHMARDFGPSMLSLQTAMLLMTAFSACIAGGCGGYLCGLRLFPHSEPMRNLLIMGCSIQNSFIFALSLIRSLEVPWLTESVLNRCVAYVFAYSIVANTINWTAGQDFIRAASLRLTHTTLPPDEDHLKHTRFYRAIKYGSAALFTGTFVSIMFGIACGLTEVRTTAPEPLRFFFKIFYEAGLTIGTLPVPGSLLLLGVTLRNTAHARFGSVTHHPPSAESALLRGPEVKLLTVGMIFTRLIAAPIVILSIFHFVVRPLFPELGHDPAFLLVLFVESSAPTAIGCLLVLTNNSYFPQTFSVAMLFQYLSTAISSAAWLSLGLWYIG